MFPDATVDLPNVGTLYAWATKATHAGIRTEWSHNQRGTAEGVAETVTLHRVAYSVRYDLHPIDALRAEHGDKPWRVVDVGHGWAIDMEYASHALSRRDNLDHGSQAAREAAVAKVARPFAEWLTSEPGQAMLAQAGREDAQATAKAARATAAKLRAEADRLDAIAERAEREEPVTGADWTDARYYDQQASERLR